MKLDNRDLDKNRDAVLAKSDIEGRALGMLRGDTFTNNTAFDLFIRRLDQNELYCIGPGEVFEARTDMIIGFDANTQYSFRAYLNTGYRRN